MQPHQGYDIFGRAEIKPAGRGKGKLLESAKGERERAEERKFCVSVSKVVGEWHFSLIHCDILLTLDVMMCTASILNLCAISIDRWGLTLLHTLYSNWLTVSGCLLNRPFTRMPSSALLEIW